MKWKKNWCERISLSVSDDRTHDDSSLGVPFNAQHSAAQICQHQCHPWAGQADQAYRGNHLHGCILFWLEISLFLFCGEDEPDPADNRSDWSGWMQKQNRDEYTASRDIHWWDYLSVHHFEVWCWVFVFHKFYLLFFVCAREHLCVCVVVVMGGCGWVSGHGCAFYLCLCAHARIVFLLFFSVTVFSSVFFVRY